MSENAFVAGVTLDLPPIVGTADSRERTEYDFLWSRNGRHMAESSDQSDPDVPIVCSACGTETRVPLAELADTLERHNQQRHDGEEIAQVDPELADQLADLVAEELGLL